MAEPGKVTSYLDFRFAWRDANYGDLRGSAREVVNVIGDRCNPAKGTGFTGGDAGLAKAMGVHIDTAKRARKAAVASGWVREVRKGVPGVNGEYMFAIPRGKAQPVKASGETPAQSCHRDFPLTWADCQKIVAGKGFTSNVNAAIKSGMEDAKYEQYAWQGHVMQVAKTAWHGQVGSDLKSWRAPILRVPLGDPEVCRSH